MKINLLEVLFWIVMLALFIMILSRIFGNSATDIQVHVAFFSGLLIIASLVVSTNNKVMSHLIKINREIGEIKSQMKTSFDKVKEDIN